MAAWASRVTLLLCLLPPVAALAAQSGSGEAEVYYRYLNDKGVPVLDRLGVPPEYIGKGYQVLNEQGRVIKVVPPAPTEAERQRLAEDKERAASDAQLLRLYSTVEDVDRALSRKLVEIDSLIGVARGNQQSLRTQQVNMQSQAAELERSGRKVPAHLVTQIDNLKSEQRQLDADIARYLETRQQAEASFSADRARLAELLSRRSGTRTASPAP